MDVSDYDAKCADCGLPWAGASERELVEIVAPDRCPDCGGPVEIVEMDF